MYDENEEISTVIGTTDSDLLLVLLLLLLENDIYS